jgi:hypothetical protein
MSGSISSPTGDATAGGHDPQPPPLSVLSNCAGASEILIELISRRTPAPPLRSREISKPSIPSGVGSTRDPNAARWPTSHLDGASNGGLGNQA